MEANMDHYRKHVRHLAAKRDGTPVFNGSTEHAAIIAETMFAVSNSEVCILSGKMNARVYAPKEVREQIDLFLADDSHRLRVLLEDYSESNLTGHPFFEQFLKHENVEVRGIPVSISASLPFHFMVMDSDSYRFETDKTKHEAVATFGEVKGATNLKTIFESIWCESEQVGKPAVRPT